MPTDRISSYLSILTIRNRSLRWGAMLTGAVFFSVMVFSIYAAARLEWEAGFFLPLLLFDLLGAVTFIIALVRYEINKEKIELLIQLR